MGSGFGFLGLEFEFELELAFGFWFVVGLFFEEWNAKKVSASFVSRARHCGDEEASKSHLFAQLIIIVLINKYIYKHI